MSEIQPAPTTSADPNGGIYLIAAHPRWRESRVNRQMLAAAAKLPHVTILDLYERYPEYHIDVAAEQAQLEAARLVVLMHPIQWYSMPSLQKLWIDEVLTWGWAYGTGGRALHGKDLWLAVTTGGSQESYHAGAHHGHRFDAFLPPYEQTAHLCGMRFLPPLILHSAQTAPQPLVTAHVDLFVQRLQTYPHWPDLSLDDASRCGAPPPH